MTRSASLNKIVIGLIDILIFIFSYGLALLIRYGTKLPAENLQDLSFMLPFFVLVFIILANVYNLYSEYIKYDETLIALFWIIILGTIIDIAMSFIFRQFAVPRTIFLITAGVQIILLGIWRYLVWTKALMLKRPRSTIVIGSSLEIEKLIESINLSLSRGLGITSKLLIDNPEDFQEQWNKFIASPEADRIQVMLLCSSITMADRRKVISYAMKYEKKVFLVPGLYDIMLQNATLVSAGDVPLMQLGGLLNIEYLSLTKRLMDIILSLLGLIILSPLMLFIALAIKLDSPGPVFYSQTRTGFKGKTFKVYKFRTMVKNAEKFSGPVLATEQDPRITRTGSWLRKTRMDEIPQFWNVFCGNMSLVGPRPERPYFVEEFSEELPEFDYRHLVKGGITGLAQIEGRYSTKPRNKLNYDLFYAQNKSLLLDIVILLRTAKVLFQKDKAS